MKKTKTNSKRTVSEEVSENNGATNLAATDSNSPPEQIPIDSLAAILANIERGSVLRELRHTIVRTAINQEKKHGASTKEAVSYATDPHPLEPTEEVLKRIEKTSLENLDWWDIAILFGRDQQQAEHVW